MWTRIRLVAISLTAALAIGTLASSCAHFQGTIYYSPRFPIIPKPDRPNLVAVDEPAKMSPEAVASNMNALMNYAKKLEIGIDEYNKFAAEKNKAFEPEKKP